MVGALFLFLAASAGFEDSFRAGLLALQNNDLPAAVANLEQSSKLAPGNGRVWIALSQTYWKLGESAKAEEAAGKASSLAPDDIAVLQSLAIYYSESGQSLKAAEAQTSYALKAPQNSAARDRAVALYFEAVQPLLKNEKFADAISILEPARKRLPGSAQIELALGVAYYGSRRFEDAAGAFLRTAGIAPDLDQPYTFLGEFLDQVPDRLPEISRCFSAYEKTHPLSYKTYLLPAKVLNLQGIEPEKTERLLYKALAMNHREPSIHWELAVLFDRLERYGDAAREYEQTVSLKPADAAAHYRLARDYDRLGNHEAAVLEREIHAQLVKKEGAVR